MRAKLVRNGTREPRERSGWMEIKAIETEYNGYRFRSRLEARWAVFFDSLGVKYEYEPEGFILPSGKRYLPDFKVKCYGRRGVCADDMFLCFGCINKIYDKEPYWDYGEKFCRLFDIYDENGENGYATLPDFVKFRKGLVVECLECKRDIFDLYIEVKGQMTKEDAEKIREFSKEHKILVVGNIPQKGCSSDAYNIGAYNGMDGTDICPFNYELIDGDYFAAYPAAKDGRFYLWGDDSNYIDVNDEYAVEEAYNKARQARFEHGEKPKV